MNIAIVAFPDLEDADREWIEAFRAKHDPQARRIGVHFTLVFPTEASPADVASELALVAESTAPIAFVIRRTECVADTFGHGSHVFLVPDEGGAAISALHDHLYAGMLKAHLLPDVPFIPHMTVAAADSTAAVRLASQLDVTARPVRGVIRALELLDVGAVEVRSVAACHLTGS